MRSRTSAMTTVALKNLAHVVRRPAVRLGGLITALVLAALLAPLTAHAAAAEGRDPRAAPGGRDAVVSADSRARSAVARRHKRARVVAAQASRIPIRILQWLGQRAAKRIARRTRSLAFAYGRREAIRYYCRQWYWQLGGFPNWYYWAQRDWRAAASWRFCSLYWR